MQAAINKQRRVYFIRHGEGFHNIPNHQSPHDPELTARGWLQCKALYQYFQNKQVLQNKCQCGIIITGDVHFFVEERETATFGVYSFHSVPILIRMGITGSVTDCGIGLPIGPHPANFGSRVWSFKL